MRVFKEKVNSNVQFNFNNSTEISYWAKKLNIETVQLQQIFVSLGSSISKTIAYCNNELNLRKRQVSN
jgi:hypothetical protein